MDTARRFCLVLVLIAIHQSSLASSARVPLVGIGDSLGEGVQSANVFLESQPNSYLKRIAVQMRIPFPQPLLTTTPFASVFSDSGRVRLSPSIEPRDLAVSGASTLNVLTATATEGSASTEADLVLPPYFGMSQVAIVEQLQPELVLAWVGSDDLISEILNFDALGSQSGVTPLATFTIQYRELVSRLKNTGAHVVLSNIPDLTKIAYLFDNDDLTRYTGTNYRLPAGSVTTLTTMLLLKLGVFDAAILRDPNFVLTSAQLLAIQHQIQQYNQVIANTAGVAGVPVVDAYAVFDDLIADPITIEGITIGTHYNGGAFSLDGVHPSDSGHAVFANVFITAADSAYGLTIPPIPYGDFVQIFNADPFIDFGGNGVVKGRPFTGLLETLGPLLGLSGSAVGPATRATAAEFMREYYAAKGLDSGRTFSRDDVINAVTEMLGLKRSR